ncbi:MAG TPA: outer membrane protein assembly factor BamD [Gemmatimonadaceae bacterium]|jgi:outer membrane protein assembly factor BamD
MHRFWKLAVVSLVVVAGCHPEFQLKKFTTNEALYQASLRQFNRGKWDDASAGFEKLTLDLSPRDTLAARSFWYLGLSRQHQHDWALAAQAFNRIFEGFPDDTLVDDALFQQGKSYQAMWTRTDRDATYGDAALAQFSSLMTYQPNSPLIPQAQAEIAKLQNMFAIKNYDIAMYYYRDKAFDSAIISLKEVLENWPETPKAKDAALKLIDAYRQPTVRYLQEADEICSGLRLKFPNDAQVVKSCPPPPTVKVDSATRGKPPAGAAKAR